MSCILSVPITVCICDILFSPWVICSVVHIVCYGFFYVKSVPTEAWLDYTFSYSFQVTVFQQFLGRFMILLPCCSSSLFTKQRPFNTVNQTYQYLLSINRHNVCWCYNALWVQYTCMVSIWHVLLSSSEILSCVHFKIATLYLTPDTAHVLIAATRFREWSFDFSTSFCIKSQILLLTSSCYYYYYYCFFF